MEHFLFECQDEDNLPVTINSKKFVVVVVVLSPMQSEQIPHWLPRGPLNAASSNIAGIGGSIMQVPSAPA